MEIKFNKEAVMKFYKLLNHKKFTEIRCLDPLKKLPPMIKYVDNEKDFINICKEYNGKYNVYAGVGDRLTNKGSASNKGDVSSISIIFLDLDAVRMKGFEKEPATDGELKGSEQAQQKILISFKEAKMPEPHLIKSGNGHQIAIPIPRISLTSLNRDMIEKKLQLFQNKVISKYSTDNASIDNIGDLPRIIKVVGTYNIKSEKGISTPERPFRVAEFLNEVRPEENKKLLDYILSLEEYPEPEIEVKEISGIEENYLPKCIHYLEFEHKFSSPEGWNRVVMELASFYRTIGLNQENTLQRILNWQNKQIYHEEGENKDIKKLVSLVFDRGLVVANCEKLRKEDSGFPKAGLKSIFKNIKLGECCGRYKNPAKYYQVKVAESGTEELEGGRISGRYIGQGKFGAYVKVDAVVEDILEESSFKTIYGKRGEDVWAYDKISGLWKLNGREMIKTRTEELLNYMAKIKAVNEVFEKIKRLTATSRDDFNKTPEELICLKNGVLDVKANKLLPFNPGYNFRTKLELTYDKNKDCPKIKEFFEETFYPEDIPVIQEWLGFHLFKRYFIKKAVILFGPKDTGKTIFLNLLIKFIGEKNKAGISLHLIAKNDKFTLAFLKDKFANIYDDLSFKDINDAGGFKIACGGGFISAEEKFGDSFEFLNFAKNTFATNKIPVLDSEPDEAYYLRWLPIPCDSEIPLQEQDKFLIEKLTTEEELSGLLNYSLEGLQRLFTNGCFSFNKNTEEIKNLMEKNSNHFVAFVQDCLVKKEGGRITKEEMFELYKSYAEKNKLRMHTKTQLGRGLEKYAPFISAKREKERYWEGGEINPKNTTLTTLLENLRGIRDRKNNISPNNINNPYKRSLMDFEEASKVSKTDQFSPSELKSAGWKDKEELQGVLDD